MMPSPESPSRFETQNSEELDIENSFTPSDHGLRPPSGKSKSAQRMNPFHTLSDTANFPPFHQAIADDADETCNHSDFRLSDLSIGALAALTEHQRHIAKHGLDNSLCGLRDHCHDTTSESSPNKEHKNPLDAEWSRLLESSSLVNSAILYCETSALQCVEEGINVHEVASQIPSLNEGSDYFESSRVWALKTPERARQRRNFITSRDPEHYSFDAEVVTGSPISHGLPDRSPEMSPPSFGVSPMFSNGDDGSPTEFAADRDSSIVSLSAINLSHISGVDLGEGSEILFDTEGIGHDFASDTKMRLFQDEDAKPSRPSSLKIPKQSTIPQQYHQPASANPSSPPPPPKTLRAPVYAHRYNATRSMYAAKIARAYVPSRSPDDKPISAQKSSESPPKTCVPLSRAPLAVVDNKASLSMNLQHSASKKDGKENGVMSHLPYSSPPRKLESIQNTTALSTPPVPTPVSDAALRTSKHIPGKSVGMKPTRQLSVSPTKSERLRYRSVVPIRVFLEDREIFNGCNRTSSCQSNVDQDWYVQHDSLSVPLETNDMESYSRMFELAIRKS